MASKKSVKKTTAKKAVKKTVAVDKSKKLPKPAEFRKLWVEALRSGEYKQGKYTLHKNGRYCCLGVACDLYNQLAPEPLEVTRDKERRTAYDGHEALCPPQVQSALGLETLDGMFEIAARTKNPLLKPIADQWNKDYNRMYPRADAPVSLAELNDDYLYNFEQIADVIESRPAGLFTPNKKK